MLRGKTISLNVQKIIMWIPFVNGINLFIYIYNAWNKGWTGIKFLKGLLLIFISVILSTLLFQAIQLLNFGNIFSYIINLIYIYFTGILMGGSLIRYQKKLMEGK